MEGWYRVTAGAGRLAFRGLGVRTRWHGLENLPATGPVLLAANHVSYPDFLFIGQAALARDRWVRFMCRDDIWTGPSIVARAMDGMRHIPVDREAPAAAYLRARRLLAQGEAVGTFPEAGISHSYTVRSLMRGTAALAREGGVPIVPVAIWGSQRLYTLGRHVNGLEQPPDLTRGRLIDVSFGEPMTVERGDDLAERTRALGVTLTAMLEELQLKPEHRPGPAEYAPWYPAHLGGHAPDRREALGLDHVPRRAVPPSWGPPPDVPAH